MRHPVDPALPDSVTRSNWPYISLILAFLSGLFLLFAPDIRELLVPKWAALFLLVFFLPGFLLASTILKRVELQSLEVVMMGLALSPIILLLTSLALILSYQTLDQIQILSSILIIITLLWAIIFLKAPSRKKTDNGFLQRVLSSLQRHKWISGIIAFALAIRLASFFIIYRNSISSDIDIWLVYEVLNGRLLTSYTSILQYLGIAPYSYPLLFHLLSGSVKVLGQLQSSDLFLINLVPSLVPLLFCYVIVKNSYGMRSAVMSSFALSTAPIFIFDTLPGTFKAKALFYVFVSAELYCASKILTGQKRFWLLLFLFVPVSLLTYREAIVLNALIVSALIAAIFVQSRLTIARSVGVASSILGAVFFAFSYISYTPSLGLIETAISSLAKLGLLLIFCVVGLFYSIRRGRAIDHFLSIVALVCLAVTLFNWKAADSAPILLAPLAGVGLIYSVRLLDKLRTSRPSVNLKVASLVILMVGLITATFGLTYYPTKYYVDTKPEIFDEIGAIRQFVSESKPQKGAVIYGTGYTELAMRQAYASIFILGPEQETFFYTYSLHHLVSTDFDPWIIKHSELVYESVLQLHNSLYTQNGEGLKQFLESFAIQYLIVEKTPVTDKWIQSNKEILEERFATQNYRVLEASTTKPLIALLGFIQEKIPEHSKILSPYFMSPSIHELGEEYIMKDLKSSFNFNYIQLYERIKGGPGQASALGELKVKVDTLRGLYHDALKLQEFASNNGFDYVIADSPSLKNALVSHGQKLLFSQDNLALLEVNKNFTTQSSIATNPTQTGQCTLTINVFKATSFTPERYSLTSPARDVYIEVQHDGEKIGEGYTDSSGTIGFNIPSGTYLVSAKTGDVTIKRQVVVDSYTFLPLVIHEPAEDPMQKFSTPFLFLISGVVLIPTVPIWKSKPESQSRSNML